MMLFEICLHRNAGFQDLIKLLAAISILSHRDGSLFVPDDLTVTSGSIFYSKVFVFHCLLKGEHLSRW